MKNMGRSSTTYVTQSGQIILFIKFEAIQHRQSYSSLGMLEIGSVYESLIWTEQAV